MEVSKLVNNIKTVTSRRLRSDYKQHLAKFYCSDKPLFWSSSAIISVGAGATLVQGRRDAEMGRRGERIQTGTEPRLNSSH